MYLLLKTVHILAVVAFLGNISVGVFWKRIADRSGNAAIVAHALGGIIAADRIFTIPGVVVIVAAGIGLATIGGFPFLSTGWLLWGIVLFVLAGIAFVPLTRVQQELLTTAQSGLATAHDREKYEALSKQWDLWGGIALVLPLIALVLMVMKPGLPAFRG